MTDALPLQTSSLELPPRLAVLLSGSGRTLQNLLDAIALKTPHADVVIVGSSKPDVKGLAIAQSASIPTFVVERRQEESEEAFSRAIFEHLVPYRPHLIVLAGFLRKLVVPEEWERRILNIHPALLPEMSGASGRGFYGDRVHAEVLRLGSKYSGATVHLVDNGYDSGPVLARTMVPVRSDDTVESLAARVFRAECDLYPLAIGDYLESQRAFLMKDIASN